MIGLCLCLNHGKDGIGNLELGDCVFCLNLPAAGRLGLIGWEDGRIVYFSESRKRRNWELGDCVFV